MSYNTNSQIESFPGYQWWKKQKRKAILYNSFSLFLTTAFFGFIVGITFKSGVKISDVIIFGLFGLVPLFFAIRGLIQYFKSFKWQVENYWYGVIIDMKIMRTRKGKIRGYIVTVDVGDGKQIDGYCLAKTYYNAERGQQILVFSIGDEKTYCVHANM